MKWVSYGKMHACLNLLHQKTFSRPLAELDAGPRIT